MTIDNDTPCEVSYCGNKDKCEVCIESYFKGEKQGYNKAIDDFIKFASDMPTVDEEDGTIRPMWLEEMVEKLKVGGIKGMNKVQNTLRKRYNN